MEKHPNVLATNLVKEVKTICRLKRKLSQDLYLIYNFMEHVFFKTLLNCQMYY